MHSRHLLTLIAGLGLCADVAPAAPAQELDVLQQLYAPHTSADDPLAFPMKVRSVAAGTHSLWYGGKELFFRWCRQHAAHWLADRQAYMLQQGDQHLGNVGSYLVHGSLGDSAFGMVDFDDSHRLPFQFELLQGMITLRLAARESGIGMAEPEAKELAVAMVQAYNDAAASDRSATELLAGNQQIAELIGAAARREYGKELKKYTLGQERFPTVRATGKGLVKDILRPAMHEADAIAEGIAEAVAHSPALARSMRHRDVAAIRTAIKDIALRTRVGSAGSQGLRKYFVLMQSPLVHADHDVIFYLKEQIPSAAERSGIIPLDGRPPARRCAEDMAALSRPAPAFNSWCRIGGGSFWFTIHEPWTDELEPEDIRDAAGLRNAAAVWAVAAGATHRNPGEAGIIRQRSTPLLIEELLRLSHAYVAHLDAIHAGLRSDPRVAGLISAADTEISRYAPLPRQRASSRRVPGKRGPRQAGSKRRQLPPPPSPPPADSANAPTGF